MPKRFLTGAVLALAAGLATSAAAGGPHTLGFEDQPAFTCSPGVQHDGGLSFSGTFMTCYYSPKDPADFPFVPTSTVMGVGASDVTVTEDDSSVFDLLDLDLTAGVATTPGDTTLVTGFLHGGGTVFTTLTLNETFEHHVLNWNGLDSVVFARVQSPDGYIAFDNIHFNGNGFDTTSVPEPAEWFLMLGGLLASGYMLRRARQLAAVEA